MSSPSPLNRPSGLPLRAEPEKLLHPYMGAVNISGLHNSSTVSLPFDIINNVASDTRIPTFGGDNPTTAQLNNDNHPAPERAACVPDTRFVRVSAVLAQDAEAVRFAAFQAATDAWIANPTPANKSAMIDANIKWHKIGGGNG